MSEVENDNVLIEMQKSNQLEWHESNLNVSSSGHDGSECIKKDQLPYALPWTSDISVPHFRFKASVETL